MGEIADELIEQSLENYMTYLDSLPTTSRELANQLRRKRNKVRWQSRDGTVRKVDELTDTHIGNIINWIRDGKGKWEAEPTIVREAWIMFFQHELESRERTGKHVHDLKLVKDALEAKPV